MSDSQLIDAYLQGDPAAFAALVARYVDLVHGAAARHAPADADDITQAVFLLLSRRAARLRGRISLAGWLFHAAMLCARNTQRSQRRRRHHEREAAMQRRTQTSQEMDQTADLLPLLDEAIASLRAGDREIVLQRHFQNRNLADIAADMGISAPAAAKRAQRALERMRRYCLRRGAPASTAALGGALVMASAHRAPAALLSSTAPSAGAASIAHAVAPAIGGGIAPALIVVAAAVLIAGGVGIGLVAFQRADPPMAVAPATAPVAPFANQQTPEYRLPGRITLASFDMLIEKSAADRLRALARPVQTASKAYAAWITETGTVADPLRAMLANGESIPPQFGNLEFVAPPNDGPWHQSIGFNTVFQLQHNPNSYVFGLSNLERDFSATFEQRGEQLLIRADIPAAQISSRESSTEWLSISVNSTSMALSTPGRR